MGEWIFTFYWDNFQKTSNYAWHFFSPQADSWAWANSGRPILWLRLHCRGTHPLQSYSKLKMKDWHKIWLQPFLGNLLQPRGLWQLCGLQQRQRRRNRGEESWFKKYQLPTKVASAENISLQPKPKQMICRQRRWVALPTFSSMLSSRFVTLKYICLSIFNWQFSSLKVCHFQSSLKIDYNWKLSCFLLNIFKVCDWPENVPDCALRSSSLFKNLY